MTNKDLVDTGLGLHSESAEGTSQTTPSYNATCVRPTPEMALSETCSETLPDTSTEQDHSKDCCSETMALPDKSPPECCDNLTTFTESTEQTAFLSNNKDNVNASVADCSKSDKKSKSQNVKLQKMTSCYDNAPDGGWGWVVTFSAFMVGVILDGISFSFGLFFKELLMHFNATKSQTSWIISVLNGTYLGIGPIVSVFVGLFGCRKVAIFGATLAAISFFACTWSPTVEVMIVLYGLLGGAGLGLLYLPAIVSVGHYFTSKRALATGIAVCGSGIGAFVFAPLSEFLIELYGWKGAMWIIAAVVLNGIPIAALLRPLEGSTPSHVTSGNSSNGKELVNLAASDLILSASVEQVIRESKAEKKTRCNVRAIFDFELLQSPTFLVYGASCFLCMLGFYIPFTYLPDYAEGLGLTSQDAAILISIIGILNTFSRVLVGWLADRPWTDALIINSIALVIGGAATMFVPYYRSLVALSIYSAVFGVSIAVFVSLRSIIMAELLGIEKLTSSFGLVTMCQGLSAFIGAPIAGALSDLMGDYVGAFYLAGVAIALSGGICFPLRRISAWERRRSHGPHARDATDTLIMVHTADTKPEHAQRV